MLCTNNPFFLLSMLWYTTGKRALTSLSRGLCDPLCYAHFCLVDFTMRSRRAGRVIRREGVEKWKNFYLYRLLPEKKKTTRDIKEPSSHRPLYLHDIILQEDFFFSLGPTAKEVKKWLCSTGCFKMGVSATWQRLRHREWRYN